MLNKKKKDDGQALFELIIFFPFFLLMITVMLQVSSSINASINQQKVTRSYFFYLLKNNSTFPDRNDLDVYADKNLTHVGFSSIHWRDEEKLGDVSQAPCYGLDPFSGITPGLSGEECHSDLRAFSTPPGIEKKTRFLRVYTAFGLCSAHYQLDPSGSSTPNSNHEVSFIIENGSSIGGSCSKRD